MNSLSTQATKAGKSKFSVRELCCLALMAAMMVAGQVALVSLPNIEVVSLLIIAGAVVYGYKILFSVYVFVLVEILIYGFGIWSFNYVYIWAILAVIAIVLRRVEGRLMWAVISGAYGLCFGFLCSIPYLFMGGIGAAVTYFIKGVPYDLVHCVGNFALAYFLLPGCMDILKKLAKNPAHV